MSSLILAIGNQYIHTYVNKTCAKKWKDDSTGSLIGSGGHPEIRSDPFNGRPAEQVLQVHRSTSKLGRSNVTS
jgi:hypothetical protein